MASSDMDPCNPHINFKACVDANLCATRVPNRPALEPFKVLVPYQYSLVPKTIEHE